MRDKVCADCGQEFNLTEQGDETRCPDCYLPRECRSCGAPFNGIVDEWDLYFCEECLKERTCRHCGFTFEETDDISDEGLCCECQHESDEGKAEDEYVSRRKDG